MVRAGKQLLRFIFELGFFLSKIMSKSTWGKFDRNEEISSFFNPFRFSWSQSGEDLALLHLFNGQQNGKFVDVGAHHPLRLSVTHHLSRLGWKGVNVDANSELIKIFNKARNHDTNICAAVGTEQSYSFTIFKEPALSSVNKEWKNKFQSDGWEIDRTVTVPGVSLRDIYDQNFPQDCIDLLSVDAEGSDLNVLISMDFESLRKDRFPKYLLLEATPPVEDALKTDSVAYAISIGYRPLYVLPMSTLLKRG